MKIQIRKNVFETNSSSTHSLVIPNDNEIKYPEEIDLKELDEWDYYGHTENPIAWYYQQIKYNYGDSRADAFILYLMSKDIKITNSNPPDINDFDNIFDNKEDLDNFLFGTKSYIEDHSWDGEPDNELPEDAKIIKVYDD